MRPIVQTAFAPLSKKFEGVTTWMYSDIKGLVTTGIGNLIDPMSLGQNLPWKKPDGSLASRAEYQGAWQKVKDAGSDPNGPRLKGGGNVYWRNLTDLRLDDEGIQQLFSSKLASNETFLRKGFPAYDSWPAPAQLALHLMAWALGPAFGPKWPKFSADVNKTYPDFVAAATEGHMDDAHNPGLRPRNAAVKALFLEAADALSNNADPNQLLYDYESGVAAAHQAAGTLSAKGAAGKLKNKLASAKTVGIAAAGIVGVTIAVKAAKKKGWL